MHSNVMVTTFLMEAYQLMVHRQGLGHLVFTESITLSYITYKR